MIANGQIISAADLSDMTTWALGNLAARAAYPILGHPMNFTFSTVGADAGGTTPFYREARWVSPYDALLETIVVNGALLDASSTQTVRLESVRSEETAPEDMMPVELSFSVNGSGVGNATRTLYRNEGGISSSAYADANPAVRVLKRGATYRLTVSSTSSLTTSPSGQLQVSILTRTPLSRTT